MWNNHEFTNFMGYGAPVWLPLVGVGFLVLVVWGIFWKGLALWHSAQRGQPVWFIILLLVNTAGILEIIYLFGIAKLKFNSLFSNHGHHHDHAHH